MLSEGTLISGGEKDRKIAAWDSLQNYKRITETKVMYSIFSLVLPRWGCEISINIHLFVLI